MDQPATNARADSTAPLSFPLPKIESSNDYASDPEVRRSVAPPLVAWAAPSCAPSPYPVGTTGCQLPSSRPTFRARVNIPQVWDVIIVGAGVAGAALAYKQAKVCALVMDGSRLDWQCGTSITNTSPPIFLSVAHSYKY